MKYVKADKSYKDIESRIEAKEIIYIVCPLCGRNRVFETERKGELRWNFFEPETSSLVQIRQPSGKARGFPLKRSLTWEQTRKISEFKNQIRQIRVQIKKIKILSE